MRIAACFLALAFAVPVIAAPEPAKSGSLDDSAKIAEKLLERISVDEPLDKIAFRDALKFLQDRTDLVFLIDKKDPPRNRRRNGPVDRHAAVSLPAMKNVRVETILRLLNDRFGS